MRGLQAVHSTLPWQVSRFNWSHDQLDTILGGLLATNPTQESKG